MSDTKLLPCPFCGGTDAFVDRAGACTVYVMCNDCRAQGPVLEEMRFEWDEAAGRDAAIEAWNRRHGGDSTSECRKCDGHGQYLRRNQMIRCADCDGIGELPGQRLFVKEYGPVTERTVTLEQIDRGARWYERESVKASAQAEHHKTIGSPWAKEWHEKAIEFGRVAAELRSLASPSPAGA